MNPEQQPQAFYLNYNDVADHIFQRLLDLGYVPESDEVLDLSDIIFEFLVTFIAATGAEMQFIEYEEGDE